MAKKAKKSKAKKKTSTAETITRRGAARARETTQARPERCGEEANVSDWEMTTSTGQLFRVMVADTCCEESRRAILHGVDEPNRVPTPNTKRHLRRLTDRLRNETLDEYCYMIWGLDQGQLDDLRANVPARLKLRAAARK